MKHSLSILCILLLTSCSSVYRFAIEVQEPAPITLPSDVVDVLVVNNSAPQPGNLGINRMYKGTKITDKELELDSLAGIAATSLADQLKESDFFNRVGVIPASLRSDKNWMGGEALTETFRTETFKTHGFNGIVSIDRLMVLLEQDVRNDYYMSLTVNSVTTCTVYLSDRETPLTRFSVADSLSFFASVLGDTTEIFKNVPEYALNQLAYTIGERLSQRIIPSWTEKERFLYAGSRSRMVEALNFSRAGHWDRATNLWLNEYAHRSKPEAKGRIAANLAVACEIQDRFDDALQWATTAQNHFREAGLPDTSTEKTRIDAYLDDLQKRIRDNYLLDIQWGM
jgi:hypothetical protein